jgi:uncharacterized protein (DUF2344 family)
MCDFITEEVDSYANKLNSVLDQIMKIYKSEDTDKLIEYYENNTSMIKSLSYFINLNEKCLDLKIEFDKILEHVNKTKVNL